MSRIEELINRLCPDGVEFKKLGEVCKVLRGKRLTTRDLSSKGKYPVFHGGNIPIGYYHTYNRTANSTMVINVGASAGTIGYSNVDFWSSDGCFCFSYNECLIQKYLFYYLQSIEQFIKSRVRKAGIPTLDNKVLERVSIPIPPLEIQQEIVRILDNFTELTNELTNELTARKKQYEYYRDKVFKIAFSNGISVKLGEIASFSQGIQIEPNKQYRELKPGRIRFLRIVDFVSKNEPYRYIDIPDKKYIKTEGELIMVRYGASAAGKVFVNHTGAIANNMFKVNLKNNILPRYLLHYLSQDSIYFILNSCGGKSTMPAVNFKSVSKINIPLVSLSEQQRIVSILDRFDQLCNDLTAGLPAEIEARRKQYEYYRDKLLTFKEKKT